MFEVVKKLLFLDMNWSKIMLVKARESGHCDKSTLQIYFIFTILNTYVSLILHAKI